MKQLVVPIIALLMISCSANVDQLSGLGISSDPTIDTGKNNPNNPTPGVGGDGTGGNCYEDPTIGRICSKDSGDMFGDPNDVGVITVEALNLNSQEYLRGGGEYIIKYRAKITYQKFKSVYSKIEIKRDADQNWTTIADKLVSNDGEIVSHKWNICPHPQNASCEFDADGNPVLLNGSDYKIRITSNRIAQQSGSTVSNSSFTIDSGLPVLQTYSAGVSGLTVSGSGNGFVNLNLLGASDALTRISKLCLKLQPSAPLVSDSCWMPAKSFNPSYSPSPNSVITLSSIPIFLGYSAKSSFTYYVWLMDQSGNISDLSSAVDDDGIVTYGVEKKDMVTVDPLVAVTYATPAAVAISANPTQLATDLNTPGFNLKTDGSATVDFESSIGDLRQSMGDPNSFVVTSAGVAYVKMSGSSTPKGILKINLSSGATSVFIPQGNHTTGAVPVTGKVYDPMKITLDHEENLWIMDKMENGTVVVSKVTDLSGSSPTLVDVIGKGTNDTIMVDNVPSEMAANQLKINDNSNLRWYGAFASLPDGSLVFSSEDPTLKVKDVSAATSYSLRIYTPSRPSSLQVRTLILKSTDKDGVELFSSMGNAVQHFRPYGSPAFTFDWTKNDIDKIYLRFCAWNTAGPCSELVYAEFDGQGNFVRYLPDFMPWHFGNEILNVKGDKLFVMNSYGRTLAQLPLTTEGAGWTSVLSTAGLPADYCENGIASGQCQARIMDVFVSNTGRIYFIDHKRIRFIDDDGKVHSIVQVGT